MLLIAFSSIEAVESPRPVTAASLILLCEQDESVKGILTILCNHSFHVACLAEWKDTRYLHHSVSEMKSSKSVLGIGLKHLLFTVV